MKKLFKQNREIGNSVQTFETLATCGCACVCSCACQPSYAPSSTTKSSGASSDKSSYLSQAKKTIM